MQEVNEIAGTRKVPEDPRNLIMGLDTLVRLDDGQMAPAINLDNAATTPPFKAVWEKIGEELLYYGSIGRGRGQKSEHSSRIYTEGRDAIKRFVGADSDKYTVFYVNCTTDGMNKLASALIESPDDLILTTRMEHHANDLPWRERANTLHVEVDEAGRLRTEEFEKILTENCGRIKYVSVTAASNVTGYVNDVHAIAKTAHQHGAKIIVDGAQIVAHRSFQMLGASPDEDIDFFVFSAHKMYSPFGGGAVVGLTDELNRHIPIFYGGGMVKVVYDESVIYTGLPDVYEAGSPNYPGVVGMIEAADILSQIGFEYIREHEQYLLRRALDGLKSVPEVVIYGDSDDIADRVGILVFNINGVDNEEVARKLSEHRGIAVRHAAFCAHPYVRRLAGEMLSEPEDSDGGCTPPYGMVRISFGIYNTDKDVDALLETVRDMAKGKILAAADKNTTDKKDFLRPADRG